MEQNTLKISKELKERYDSQYSDESEEWRRIGAIGKVENIIEVSRGLRFNKVIDIGAGDGNVLSLLSRHNFAESLTAAEISLSAIEQIKKKNIPGLREIKQFDGYTLPFEDKEFDLAICSHVIEHVEHPRKLIREIRRISKNQIFEVPIDFSFNVDRKFKHYNSYGHINIYTPSLFNFLLYSEGLEIIRQKNSLYRKEVLEYEFKHFSLKYAASVTKRILWRVFPVLLKIKPNTHTVLTK